MKYLILTLLFVLVSCGKDNKSGDLSVPSGVNPLRPQQEFLVGHWVEQNVCESIQRGRNSYIKVRYEMRFFPTNGRYDSMAMGTVFYGGVEYINHCERDSLMDETIRKQIYVVSSEGLKLPTNRGRLVKFEVKIISQDVIEFKGKTLMRVSADPHL